jgi:ribosomal subunit interface protein
MINVMNIKITKFELNPKTRNYLNKRLEQLKKFVDLKSPNTNLDIEIGKTTRHHRKGDIFKTELNLTISGKYYRAEEESESIESSIDLATEELLKQLRRNKDKKETLLKRGGRKIKSTLKGISHNKN